MTKLISVSATGEVYINSKRALQIFAEADNAACAAIEAKRVAEHKKNSVCTTQNIANDIRRLLYEECRQLNLLDSKKYKKVYQCVYAWRPNVTDVKQIPQFGDVQQGLLELLPDLQKEQLMMSKTCVKREAYQRQALRKQELLEAGDGAPSLSRKHQAEILQKNKQDCIFLKRQIEQLKRFCIEYLNYIHPMVLDPMARGSDSQRKVSEQYQIMNGLQGLLIAPNKSPAERLQSFRDQFKAKKDVLQQSSDPATRSILKKMVIAIGRGLLGLFVGSNNAHGFFSKRANLTRKLNNVFARPERQARVAQHKVRTRAF